jgi:hypothetical protein
MDENKNNMNAQQLPSEQPIVSGGVALKPKMPTKWLVIFTILGIATLLTVCLPIIATIYLSITSSNDPQSLDGLVFLVYVLPVFVVGAIVVILDLIAYFVYNRGQLKVEATSRVNIGRVVVTILAIVIAVPVLYIAVTGIAFFIAIRTYN